MRGELLRTHILWTAKDVFLAEGFERAAMDAIAKQAGTTKRTLYAHFDNKEALFLSVVGLVNELLAGKLNVPETYAEDPVEALTRFCAQFRRMMLWGPSVRTCRLGIAEAERFPEGATGFYEALFASPRRSVQRFLHERAGLPPDEAAAFAETLLSRSLDPGFMRALFGSLHFSDEWQGNDEALRDVRAAGVELMIHQRLRPQP